MFGQLAKDVVSPAPAGMDRKRSEGCNRVRGFPRTRGDGPEVLEGMGSDTRFPPHPRGWTLPVHKLHLLRVVSPAPAGMDLRRARPGRSASRFPRTRGDGPFWKVLVTALTMFPPHPRGWTRRDLGVGDVLGVSPAPAGMDPGRRPASRGSRCPSRPVRLSAPPAVLTQPNSTDGLRTDYPRSSTPASLPAPPAPGSPPPRQPPRSPHSRAPSPPTPSVRQTHRT